MNFPLGSPSGKQAVNYLKQGDRSRWRIYLLEQVASAGAKIETLNLWLLFWADFLQLTQHIDHNSFFKQNKLPMAAYLQLSS